MLYGCTLVDVADNLFDAIDTNLKQEGHCLVAEMVVKSEQETLDRKQVGWKSGFSEPDTGERIADNLRRY